MQAIKIEFNNNVIRVLLLNGVTYFDIFSDKVEVRNPEGIVVFYKGIRPNELNESNFQAFIEQIYSINAPCNPIVEQQTS
jgi:hypothetical protein